MKAKVWDTNWQMSFFGFFFNLRRGELRVAGRRGSAEVKRGGK